MDIMTKMIAMGWYEEMTGGGCMAWVRPSTNDAGYMMLTDGDGCDFPKPDGEALLGFYNKEGDAIGSYLRFPFSDLLDGKVRIG